MFMKQSLRKCTRRQHACSRARFGVQYLDCPMNVAALGVVVGHDLLLRQNWPILVQALARLVPSFGSSREVTGQVHKHILQTY